MAERWLAALIDAPDRAGRLRLLAVELPARLREVRWFALDAADGRALEVAVPADHRGVLASLAPGAECGAPVCLAPALFPRGEVPDGFGDLLVAATLAAVRVHLASAPLAPLELSDRRLGDAIRQVLARSVDPAAVSAVLTAAAAWLERVVERHAGAAGVPSPDVPLETVVGARLAHLHVVQLCLPPAGDEHLRAEARLFRDLARTV